jgi:adenosylhomocysteine nucleosidase
VIGIGDRALVGLGALAEVAGIDAHDFLAASRARSVQALRSAARSGGSWTFGRRPYSPFVHGNRLLGRHIGLARGVRPSLRPLGPAHEIGGLRFWRGQIAGREAVFVESGAGKVNAGVATSLLLDRFGCRALMLCGVAGGLDPALASATSWSAPATSSTTTARIAKATSSPSSPAAGPRAAAPTGIRLSRGRAAGGAPARGGRRPRARAAAGRGRRRPRVPGIHFGTILTGDSFINGEDHRRRLHDEFAAKAVEMEGGAIAQVVRRWGDDIPFVNVRCLSDLAGRSSHLDFRAFLPIAARYASQVAHHLAPVI